MIEIKEPRLCIVGDIHGELNTLVYNITEKYKIEDCAFIIAGDVGLGFDRPGFYESLYNRNKDRLERGRNIIYGIRGNHDDPLYFNGDEALNFPRFKTLKDYEPLSWKGRIILPVGGAQSLDVKERQVENYKQEKRGSSKKVWWPDERPVKLENFDSLPGHIDIVISHEAPLGAGHTLVRESWMDFELYDHIREDREYLYKLAKEKIPERWYFGHYHNSYSGTIANTLYRGLDIHEIAEINYYDD